MKKDFVIRTITVLVFVFLSSCSPTRTAPNPPGIPVTGLETPNPGAVQQPPVFNDVPREYSLNLGGVASNLHDHIQALFQYGITSGTSVNPPLYSPDVVMDRAHFAVFLLRAAFGHDYVPPAEPPATFTADDWAAFPDFQKWAEGLYRAGLTMGCQVDPLLYCPTKQLTRLEAAIFALRLKYNVYDEFGNLMHAYQPPDATGTIFADMADTNYYGTSWAEAAFADQILPSCGNLGDKPLFCPDEAVNRAWAAYVIVEAKNLLP